MAERIGEKQRKSAIFAASLIAQNPAFHNRPGVLPRLLRKGTMMSEQTLRSDTIWGHLPPKETMLQIGSNSFDQDGDWDKLIAVKLAGAEWIDQKVRVQASDVVLELGPGLGIQTKYFAERARLVYAVDVSNGFQEYFDRFCGSEVNVRRIVKTFFPMMDEIGDGEVDCGFAIAVFCHLHVFDTFLYLEEISRKLKRGGRFFLNYQNSDNYYLDQPFLYSLNHYRNQTHFGPIHPAQLQYHSRDFFRTAGMSVGLAVSREFTNESYTEMMFLKL